MLKKVASSSILCVILAVLPNSYAQSATIKTGTACPKVGLIKKVGSKTYICGKNPFVKPTQNTYMLRACRTGYRAYLQAKDGYETYKDLAPLLGKEGAAQIEELKSSMDSIYGTLQNEACKKGV